MNHGLVRPPNDPVSPGFTGLVENVAAAWSQEMVQSLRSESSLREWRAPFAVDHLSSGGGGLSLRDKRNSRDPHNAPATTISTPSNMIQSTYRSPGDAGPELTIVVDGASSAPTRNTPVSDDARTPAISSFLASTTRQVETSHTATSRDQMIVPVARQVTTNTGQGIVIVGCSMGGSDVMSRDCSVVERFERPVVIDQHDRLSVPGLLVTTHTRRIGRHPRKRDPHRSRSYLQQPHDGTYRDMTLNYIAIDKCCVTRTRIRRHTHVCLEPHKVRIFLNLDYRSIVL
jgi:hypothetical protein